MSRKLKQVTLHSLPLLFILSGYPYLTIAAILLVGLCYIKVFKLRQELTHIGASDQLNELQKTLQFWKSWTFLA